MAQIFLGRSLLWAERTADDLSLLVRSSRAANSTGDRTAHCGDERYCVAQRCSAMLRERVRCTRAAIAAVWRQSPAWANRSALTRLQTRRAVGGERFIVDDVLGSPLETGDALMLRESARPSAVLPEFLHPNDTSLLARRSLAGLPLPGEANPLIPAARPGVNASEAFALGRTLWRQWWAQNGVAAPVAQGATSDL